jgi:hypothetical protein
MLAIIGTFPRKDFPLVFGKITMKDDRICIEDERIPVNRGTPALMAAAIRAAEALGQPDPFGYLVGDIGLGKGSRRLYDHLERHLPRTNFSTLTFHYLQPIVHWHDRILSAVEKISPRPVLIADAGYMYMAKMSGHARVYDLFTPDVGELAFLADEKAPHPLYTRGFILHEENKVPDLVTRAYAHLNASRFLLVKGVKDYVANQDGIMGIVDHPVTEALEAIGGTGDTLTGLVSGLIESGLEISEAAFVAAKANRLAGYFANPTPATPVMEIIRQIPKALSEALDNKHGKK